MNTEYTGKQIAEFRKAKGLTQKELATVLDTTPSILLGLEDATKEELVTSFAEISNSQTEEAEKDIQKIGWMNLFAGIFLIIFMHFINIKLQRNGLYFESKSLLWLIYGLTGVVTIGAIYTLRKYKAIKKWETLDMILTEVLVVVVVIFLGIQLFTSKNPNYIIGSILIGIASICVQLLFYRVMKPQWMKALPMLLMICWLCYVVLLEVSQAVLANTDIWGLVIYCVWPLICSLVTWFVCRKCDVEKEKLIPNIKLLVIAIAVVITFVSLFAQDLLVKTSIKVFHEHLEVYAEEMLKECKYTTSDQYGLWNVTCYPEDELVEFRTGGAGLAPNSTYLGFYYSPDNTHKPFQGADVSLMINNELAHWNGEGDNWGKSTRLMDKWFWYEAHF